MKKVQPEEEQGEEAEIDHDYELTQSPYNPIGDYLGSEQETTPATKSQPMVHDAIPRYLIDQECLEQMQVDYKGTEGTQEDFGGVPEVYHPIPHIEEDQLTMDASPRMESTLLADSAQAAAEMVSLATRDTTTTALASINPDMPTAEEFLDMPKLEAAQAEEEEEWEESLVSFDVTSHQTPSLPTPKESIPLEGTKRSPAKRKKNRLLILIVLIGNLFTN